MTIVNETVRAARNIIFILVDDLRYDAMGFLRPEIATPNIDRLAREGVHFANAFVTSSLCSPSRATILTGLSMRNHRIVDNNEASEDALTFFPQHLQAAGYQTAFFGKWHFGRSSDGPRPGFDRWVSFKGQGAYYPQDYMTPEQVAAGARHRLNVDGAPTPQQGYITDELSGYALDWLKTGRDPGKPFFVYLSHKAVHAMALPAERHRDQYAGQAFPLPASAAEPTAEAGAGKPMWVRNQRNSWHGIDFFYHTGQPLGDYLRDYYRTLSAVDDSLGEILDWLAESGLDGRTTVIFSSDNGYMEGEHGLIDKRNAYEESMRVPLVMRGPGDLPAGRVVEASVSSLDYAPTLLDMAGVPAPEDFEGRSLAGLARGETAEADWAGEVIYEYYWEWNFPMTPTTFAIRSGGLKYIQYQGVWDLEELYDLRNDPQEMRNLIDDESYLERKVALRRRLFDGLADRRGEHVIPYTPRTGQGVVFRRRDGSGPADFPEQWLRDPDAADLMEGLLPDSPAKAAAARAGTLPQFWLKPSKTDDPQ